MGEELIDTLWNVNFVAKLKRPSLLAELIDTLWNVNISEMNKEQLMRFGINRYIMECKYRILVCKNEICIGINRYIMECKFVNVKDFSCIRIKN